MMQDEKKMNEEVINEEDNQEQCSCGSNAEKESCQAEEGQCCCGKNGKCGCCSD